MSPDFLSAYTWAIPAAYDMSTPCLDELSTITHRL